MLKSGGKSVIKYYFARNKVPFYTIVVTLMTYELVTCTQGKVLLAYFPDTTTVFAVACVTAIWELGTRMFPLFKIRAKGREMKDLGWTEKSRQLFRSLVQINSAVSRDADGCKVQEQERWFTLSSQPPLKPHRIRVVI